MYVCMYVANYLGRQAPPLGRVLADTIPNTCKTQVLLVPGSLNNAATDVDCPWLSEMLTTTTDGGP